MKLFMWAVNLLAILGAISINIYLPSLPAIAKSFSTTTTFLKSTVTLFLVGYSLSQFFWGSLSERFGRKKAVLWGLTIACLGSLASMLSPSIFVLNISRFIEGVGVGCAIVLGRAFLTDKFHPTQLARVSRIYLIGANVMPAVAPIVGGGLLLWFGWRAIFFALILYTLGLIILFYTKIEETHKNIKLDFRINYAFREYFHALLNREFSWYLIPYALSSAGLWAYYAVTPFIFIIFLHIPAHIYPFYSIATVCAYLVGGYLSHWLTIHLGFDQLILVGIIVLIFASLLFVLFWLFASLSILTILIPMMVFSFGTSLIGPNANGGAMSALRNSAGAAAALIGTIRWGATTLLTFILNRLDLSNLGSLAGFFSVLSIVMLILFFLFPHKTKNRRLKTSV